MSDPQRTVLIVEDAASCATTLEIALTKTGGVDVLLASNAEEARSLLERRSDICAVITDLHLPSGSGLELIGWVRQLRTSPALPIIVISGDSDPETPPATLRLGADAFFAKPFSPAEVRRKLEELIHAERRI